MAQHPVSPGQAGPSSQPATVTASSYTAMFFLGIVIAIVGAVARNIGLSPSEIGLLISAQNVGFMLGVLASGVLSDMLEKPRIMMVGSVLLSGSFATFYLSDRFAVNAVVMLVMGVGIGLYEGTSDAMLLEVHERNESLHINVNHSFVTLGSLLVTTYLIFLQMSWRRAMIQSAAAVGLLAVLFVAIRLERSPRTTRPLRERLAFVGQAGFLSAFLLLLIAVGTQLATLGVMTTYLMDLRAHDQVTSKAVAVLFLAGIGFGRILIGYLTRRGSVYRTLVLLFSLTAGLSLLFFLLDAGPLVYGLAALMGLSISGLLPLSITIVGLLYRAGAGTALGVMKFAIPLGGIVVPLAFSGLSRVVSLQTAVLLMPASFVIGAAAAVAARGSLRTEQTA